MILRELTEQDQLAFEKLLDEWDGAFGFSLLYDLVAEKDFQSYLKIISDIRDGKNLTDNYVPVTSLFAFENDVIVGKVSVRHYLNQHLENYGGHIGYTVLPDFRRQGHATEMLRQSLNFCRVVGIKKALLICDEENSASAKVIQNNGGVLENIYEPLDGSPKKMRFWIQL